MAKSTKGPLEDRVSNMVKVVKLIGAVVWLTELATPYSILCMVR